MMASFYCQDQNAFSGLYFKAIFFQIVSIPKREIE